MSPILFLDAAFLHSAPRVSGDEPRRLFQLAWITVCSPRERG